MISLIKKNIKNIFYDKKLHEVIHGSIWAISSQVFNIFFILLINIIIARFYGAEIVGLLAITQSIMMIALLLTQFGTSYSVLRLIPEFRIKYSMISVIFLYKKIRNLILFTSLGISIVIFLTADLIAVSFFNKPLISIYIKLASGFLVFYSIMDINIQVIRSLKHSKSFAIMRFSPSLFTLLILLIITQFMSSNANPILSYALSWLILGIVSIFLVNYFLKNKINKNKSDRFISYLDLFKISNPMFISSLMAFIMAQSGVILLGFFRNSVEVGYYVIALKIATLGVFIFTGMQIIAAPKISELFYQKKIDDLFYVAKKTSKLIFWTTLPILVFILVFGKFILFTFFGEEFLASYPVILILLFGQFIYTLSGLSDFFLNMTGNEAKLSKVLFISLILNLCLGCVLIPYMGAKGAAISTVFGISCKNFLSLLYIQKNFKNNIYYIPKLSKKRVF